MPRSAGPGQKSLKATSSRPSGALLDVLSEAKKGATFPKLAITFLGASAIAVVALRTSVLSRNLRGFQTDSSWEQWFDQSSASLNVSNCNYGAPKQRRKEDLVYTEYKPAAVEEYITTHMTELGLDKVVPELVTTCDVWNDPNATPFHAQLQDFIRDLDSYNLATDAFTQVVPDLRNNMTDNDNDICDKIKLHPDGLPGIFKRSGQLSLSRSGWIEFLSPSMRHPKFCTENRRQYLMPIDYLVHDFHALCQSLKPTSRTIFIDMGASLSFHGATKSPVLVIFDLFKKFGFKFDHIYAYEMRGHDAGQVHDQVPEDIQAAYHWINVGVVADPNHKRNPFKLLLDNYNEDDLVIVKLDIDTPHLEKALGDQLAAHPRLGQLIDHFYFEHHVNQEELAGNWGPTKESVADSLRFFHQLRKQGIAAHYWV